MHGEGLGALGLIVFLIYLTPSIAVGFFRNFQLNSYLIICAVNILTLVFWAVIFANCRFGCGSNMSNFVLLIFLIPTATAILLPTQN
jgi:hypothetical protein